MQGFLAAICRRAWCSRRVGVLGSRVLPGNVRDVRVHPKVHGGDKVVAVLYISPKKFIYFLKHPEDPDFRAFR